VLAAKEIMTLYRQDPGRLRRLNQLQTSYGSGEAVLYPPGSTEVFSDPTALSRARSNGSLLAVPNQPSQRHFALDPAAAAQARALGRDPSSYWALRPQALAVLYYIADEVHTLGAAKAPLTVGATVRDAAYQQALVQRHLAQPSGYSLYTTGYSFDIERRYASRAQAQAFQTVLDRLQALDVIAWERRPSVIHITASSQAAALLPLLHGAKLQGG
jgi:hypothetical protein